MSYSQTPCPGKLARSLGVETGFPAPGPRATGEHPANLPALGGVEFLAATGCLTADSQLPAEGAQRETWGVGEGWTAGMEEGKRAGMPEPGGAPAGLGRPEPAEAHLATVTHTDLGAATSAS